MQLYVGLLAAYADDRALLADALGGLRNNAVIPDYPTLEQLHQVVLAEQERLAGKPQAAVARLSPIAKRDTALVATHWALMRAHEKAGNAEAMQVQAKWLASHRGRVFTEATTTEVLRFFNVSVSAQALKQAAGRSPAAFTISDTPSQASAPAVAWGCRSLAEFSGIVRLQRRSDMLTWLTGLCVQRPI